MLTILSTVCSANIVKILRLTVSKEGVIVHLLRWDGKLKAIYQYVDQLTHFRVYTRTEKNR